MNRPSSPWMTGTVTDRYRDHPHDQPDADDDFADVEDYDAYADYERDDYDEYDGYDDGAWDDGYADPDDRHWLWVASVAGIVLLVAVAGTLMILSGGDSGTTAATVSASTSRPAPYPSDAPSSTAPRQTPSATSLPPETITSVTPTPSAAPSPTAAPPEEAAPPAADPRTITYTVTGNRQLLDLVTIIYTDERGALQTEVNVALPWTKQVTLDPGVELSSVTATSVAGQLNCTITDGAGETLAAANNNTIIANCTR